MAIPHGRDALELAGRAGYTIDLIPGQKDHQYSWSPEADVGASSKVAVASDLDIQLMWVKAEPPISLNPPWVFWRIEYGHGGCVYDVPQRSSFGLASPEQFQTQYGWQLPQRGMRLRLPARALKMFFFTPPVGAPPPDGEPGGSRCTIQVSCQPCFGMEPERLPITDLMFAQLLRPATNVPTQLPLGATEMRFSDPSTGQPIPAGLGNDVEFYDICGSAYGAPTQLNAFADWRPIPFFAAFFAVGFAAQVSYR